MIEKKDCLKAAYDNSQSWIRHYDSVLFTITFFVVSICVGYAAIKLQKSTSLSIDFSLSFIEILEVSFPISLVSLSLYVTRNMDLEVRACWKRVVRYEKALGFYDDIPELGGAIMDPEYVASGSGASSFFKMSYWAQILSLFVPVVVILIS